MVPAPISSDPYREYATFLWPSFDANSFAHAVVNNEPYPPLPPSSSDVPAPAQRVGESRKLGFGVRGGEEGGDVSAALAKLNYGVEDLNRQLRSEITKHHSELLLQAASVGGLDGDLSEVRRGLSEVESVVTRLRRKITVPHTSLSNSLTLLTRLLKASSLARRASRFTVLARRLEGQMSEIDGGSMEGGEVRVRERRERVMAEAALTLAELETLLTATMGDADDPQALVPIKAVHAVATNIPAVQNIRQRVVGEMETMVQRGISELDNPLLASSLQTAYNLSVLPSLVESLVGDLTDSVKRKIKECFDMSTLAREMGSKDAAAATSNFVYKSRARNEPTNVTMPQWSLVMWSRLEGLISALGTICIRVYTLEKVLKLKKDPSTQGSFFDEVMTTLDNKPSTMFWTTMCQALESQAKESVRTSTFIQTLLSAGYPRFLRLVQEFFLRVAVHTDTVYTASQQSPETILVLRSILPFETLYLTRSTNRLNESVSSSFSVSSSLSSSFSSKPASAPAANEGMTAARAIVNELDAARFDPLLVRAVSKGTARAMALYIQKVEAMVAHDHSATSLLGPLATVSQFTNADLASSLYHLWAPLHRSMSEHSQAVQDTLLPSINSIRTSYMSIINPVIMAIRREFSSIITRMHRVDYGKKVEGNKMGSATSAYMADLTDKLGLVRDQVLMRYKVGDLAQEWALELARFTVQTFVLHASIVKPLSESGKLKLTADTTALEFAISQYLSAYGLSLSSMGDQFKALRAFRPLLFLDNSQLSSIPHTKDVPALILLHHILSRSSISLPHQVHGWTEGEYVRWLNEHDEGERIRMVEGVLGGWEKNREQGEGEGEDELVGVLKVVLKRTQDE